jgi:hypothetical protein
LLLGCAVVPSALPARVCACSAATPLGTRALAVLPLASLGEFDGAAAAPAELLLPGVAGCAGAASLASGVGVVSWPPARANVDCVRALVCSPIATLDAEALAAAGVASTVALTAMTAATGCAGLAAVCAWPAAAVAALASVAPVLSAL